MLILLPGTVSLPSLPFCRKAHSGLEQRPWNQLAWIETLTAIYEWSVLLHFARPRFPHLGNGLTLGINETMHVKTTERVMVSWPHALSDQNSPS